MRPLTHEHFSVTTTTTAAAAAVAAHHHQCCCLPMPCNIFKSLPLSKPSLAGSALARCYEERKARQLKFGGPEVLLPAPAATRLEGVRGRSAEAEDAIGGRRSTRQQSDYVFGAVSVLLFFVRAALAYTSWSSHQLVIPPPFRFMSTLIHAEDQR